MTDFILDLISKGEESTSILILLVTQWPQMEAYVDLSWLEHVAQGGSVPTSTQMEKRMIYRQRTTSRDYRLEVSTVTCC